MARILPCLCAICDWSLLCSVDDHSKVTFEWALQIQYSRSLNVAITSDLGDLRILVYRRTSPLLFLFCIPTVILFLRYDSGGRKSTARPYSLIAHLDPIIYEWLYEGSVVDTVLRLCNCSQSDHPGIWLCSSVSCHQHPDVVSLMWIFGRYPSWLWIYSASLLLIHPWSTTHVASIYAMGW